MKKVVLFVLSVVVLMGCDKTYVCNCGNDQGGLPYKKVYLNAKTDGGAKRRCTKIATTGESCKLQ